MQELSALQTKECEQVELTEPPVNPADQQATLETGVCNVILEMLGKREFYALTKFC